MLIKLIIISVMLLPNGLAERTIEEVVGFTKIEQCLSLKELVEEGFKETPTKKLLAINCVSIGEM